jgi:hypothetical protein
MLSLPTSITISGAGFYLDGGSTTLFGSDEKGNDFEIYLDWSIESHSNAKCQLYFNKIPINKRSKAENEIIELIKNAEFKSKSILPEKKDKIKVSSKRLIIGDDFNRIIEGMSKSPEEGFKSMARELINNVISDTYVKGSKVMDVKEKKKRLLP